MVSCNVTIFAVQKLLMLNKTILELRVFLDQNIVTAHTYTVMTGSILFLLSTLTMALAHHHLNIVIYAKMILFNAIFLLIVAECLRFRKNWEISNKLTLSIFGIEQLGYCVMLLASFKQESYNQGIPYLIGSFLISVSKEISIMTLLIPKNEISKKRFYFYSSLNSCCSALVFFFSALISSFSGDSFDRFSLSSGLNCMSGVLLVFSVLFNIKSETYKGTFDATQIIRQCRWFHQSDFIQIVWTIIIAVIIITEDIIITVDDRLLWNKSD